MMIIHIVEEKILNKFYFKITRDLLEFSDALEFNCMHIAELFIYKLNYYRFKSKYEKVGVLPIRIV